MTLIIILISWLIMRYTALPAWLRGKTWFDSYCNKIEIILQKLTPRFEIRFVLLLAIPLLMAWLILGLFTHVAGHIGLFIVNLFILVYSWSETSKENPIETKAIFWQALHQPFALLFWFIVLGPIGALLYDIVSRCEKNQYNAIAAFLRNMLDWPAARLLGFGYALAGHFHPAFSYWIAHIFNDTKHNQLFLEECGLLALHNTNDAAVTTEEKQHAVALVKRAQIMLLIALALFTIGRWLY